MKAFNIKSTDADSAATNEWSDYNDAVFGNGASQVVAVPTGATRINFAPTGNYAVKFATAGIIATLGAITAGALYTDGVYPGVALIGGTGSGATADITVAGNAVTVVTPVNGGIGYNVADALSATAASIGGTGSGFSIPVATITGATAAMPSANVTNGSASSINPASRRLAGLTSFAVFAAAGVIVGLEWANG